MAVTRGSRRGLQALRARGRLREFRGAETPGRRGRYPEAAGGPGGQCISEGKHLSGRGAFSVSSEKLGLPGCGSLSRLWLGRRRCGLCPLGEDTAALRVSVPRLLYCWVRGVAVADGNVGSVCKGLSPTRVLADPPEQWPCLLGREVCSRCIHTESRISVPGLFP